MMVKKPKRSSHTRARDKEKIRAAKRERIAYILREMAECRWVPGVSGPATATRFGVSLSTIEHEAAEASRRLQDLVMSDDELRARLQVGFAHSMKMASDAGGSRGSEALTKAMTAWAQLRGLEAPKQVDVALGATLEDIARARQVAEDNGE